MDKEKFAMKWIIDPPDFLMQNLNIYHFCYAS